MKTRLLLILVIIIGFSALLLLFLFEIPSESKISDDREDLKEVAYSNNICSKTYRVEFFAMLDDKNYDYKNDPIFQDCSRVLEIEKKTSTTYVPSSKQLKAILAYYIDSKDLTDTTGLSYSNTTHYIDTINCEWEESEIMQSEE